MAKRTTKAAERKRIEEALSEFHDILTECWEDAGKLKDAGAVLPYTRRRRSADHGAIMFVFGVLTQLQERVAALEECPVDYRGTYEEGVTYPARSFCSHAGSVWWSAVKTKARPGEGPPWILAVKRGRDGKDAKP